MRFLMLLMLCLLSACGDKETDVQSNEPTNLILNVEILDEPLGKVIITASADNTVEYHFYTGENLSTEPYIQSNGTFEYFYEENGIYFVEVRAYGDSGRFIKKTQQVVIESGDPVGVGQGYVSPLSYDGFNLVWSDEFDGNTLNSDNWTFEIGDGCPNLCGWGNNELQYYKMDNTSVDNGVLTIVARKENFNNKEYTSSRIITRDKQEFKFGRVDIRAKLPSGQGLWPALWMLGSNQPSVGWPKCGEIDIMEMIGGNGRENSVHGSAHWDENGRIYETGTYSLTEGSFADQYYVFSINWTEDGITYLVNDEDYFTVSTTQDERDEFQKSFYFIINVAVGGDWPGNPNNSTIFPTQMNVDYIRVFQEN